VSEEAAFIRAICEQPADDTLRLVFADWLDEHDQSDRAEFIRLQCWHAHNWPTHALLTGCRCRSCKTLRRVRTLLDRHGATWAGVVHGPCVFIHWYRGFIETIHIRACHFASHPRLVAMFGAHPITVVRLADVIYPLAVRLWCHHWVPLEDDQFSETLRAAILNLPLFESEADAVAASSRLCVDYARQVAGFAPLVK